MPRQRKGLVVQDVRSTTLLQAVFVVRHVFGPVPDFPIGVNIFRGPSGICSTSRCKPTWVMNSQTTCRAWDGSLRKMPRARRNNITINKRNKNNNNQQINTKSPPAPVPFHRAPGTLCGPAALQRWHRKSCLGPQVCIRGPGRKDSPQRAPVLLLGFPVERLE